jgi:hypothetical protein
VEHHFAAAHRAIERLAIQYRSLDKVDPGCEWLQTPRLACGVVVDDMDLVASVQKMANEVMANKASATGDQSTHEGASLQSAMGVGRCAAGVWVEVSVGCAG